MATLLKSGLTREVEGEEGGNLRIRRTVVRYMLLSYVLCLRRVSCRVRRAFPDMAALVATALARQDEVARIGEEEVAAIGQHGGSNWWLPVQWSTALVRRAAMEDRFVNAPSHANLVKAMAAFRASLTEVVSYGHVPVPLVYTQVVHLAVYFYFAVALVERQWVQVTEKEDEVRLLLWRVGGMDRDELDLYVPIFLIFEFLFYFGWLKVSSVVYNPFGDDDDDFDVMAMIERHVKVCMAIVDEEEDEAPELRDDEFWRPPAGAGRGWRPTLAPRGREVEVEGREVEVEGRKVEVDGGKVEV